jgi:hypothetical protein
MQLIILKYLLEQKQKYQSKIYQIHPKINLRKASNSTFKMSVSLCPVSTIGWTIITEKTRTFQIKTSPIPIIASLNENNLVIYTLRCMWSNI